MTSTPIAGVPRSPEDFPQMWQKPAFGDLMECLLSLRVEPPTWNPKKKKGRRASSLSEPRPKEGLQVAATTAAFLRHEISTYLSSVISNPLAWLEDDDQKDLVWTEAARRLSERCGRAAMGEITRRWPFESKDYPVFELTIREPPLTGDSLGLKTWGSSYALARMLHQFAAGPLSHLLAPPAPNTAALGPTSGLVPVLELGSGTGLLGLAAAAIWQVPVALSDLREIVPNLAHNVDQNRAVVEMLGGDLSVGALTWGGSGEDQVDPGLFGEKGQFKIILVADPLYDDDHPGLLAGAIDDHLARDADARVLVMVPRRDATTIGLISSFRSAMSSVARHSSLLCIDEGAVASQDDWGDGEDVAEEVECWWGIFRRSQLAPAPGV
ncbi:hypothetical protein RB598_005615 [Gaeumannomyces tritici]